jgi:hypothetical protein
MEMVQLLYNVNYISHLIFQTYIVYTLIKRISIIIDGIAGTTGDFELSPGLNII